MSIFQLLYQNDKAISILIIIKCHTDKQLEIYDLKLKTISFDYIKNTKLIYNNILFL